MIDCPNCGKQVDEAVALCPHCGYHVQSQQAEEVRRLREEGKIHPGRDGEEIHGRQPRDDTVRDPLLERGELPAEDAGPALEDPRERDAGL